MSTKLHKKGFMLIKLQIYSCYLDALKHWECECKPPLALCVRDVCLVSSIFRFLNVTALWLETTNGKSLVKLWKSLVKLSDKSLIGCFAHSSTNFNKFWVVHLGLVAFSLINLFTAASQMWPISIKSREHRSKREAIWCWKLLQSNNVPQRGNIQLLSV